MSGIPYRRVDRLYLDTRNESERQEGGFRVLPALLRAVCGLPCLWDINVGDECFRWVEGATRRWKLQVSGSKNPGRAPVVDDVAWASGYCV